MPDMPVVPLAGPLLDGEFDSPPSPPGINALSSHESRLEKASCCQFDSNFDSNPVLLASHRAPVWGTEDRRFESGLPDQFSYLELRHLEHAPNWALLPTILRYTSLIETGAQHEITFRRQWLLWQQATAGRVLRLTAGSASKDTLHTQRDDEEYLRMLREEEEFWDNRIETISTRTPPAAVQSYLNERHTGDPSKRWYQTIGDEGEFTNGCVFGAGPGDAEEFVLGRHPRLHLTILDISSKALGRLQERLDKQYPNRVKTRQQDLNFVELPTETYDLAIARSSIHHLVNLEHFAFQVNRSLKSDGRFFMQDVVSESYFQFTKEKKLMFQLLMDVARDSSEPESKVRWPDRGNWEFSPFESVRSAEILDVFERYLQPLRIRTANSLLGLMVLVRRDVSTGRLRGAIQSFSRWLLGSQRASEQDTSRWELLFLLDSLMCDTGRLLPSQAFAIYAKRGD
jgi:SAM-dependent methyltransferase